MDIININFRNFKVTNYNSKIRPFEFKIEVEDASLIKKNIILENKIQKTDIFGNKLYRLKINNKYVEITNENTNYINGEPIFLLDKKDKIVNLVDYPTEFTLEDVLQHKKQELLSKNSEFRNCLLYETNLEDLVDVNYEDNNVDTGFKLINIHSHGKVKLHFNLEAENATTVKLSFNNLECKVSINGNEYMAYNDVLTFSKTINTLDIILINNSNSNVKLENICLFTK